MAQACVKQNEFVAHGSNVNAVAITPYKGRMLATGGEDRKIAIWAIGKTQPILRIEGHTSPVESVAFSISEQYIAAGSKSGTTKVFDLENNQVVRTLRGHKTSIQCLNFHGNGDIIVTGSADTNIKIWDLRRKGCVYTCKAHNDAVTSVLFSPDGRWITSGSADSTVKLWDVGSSNLVKEFNQHRNEVTSVKFHPNELVLATASMDRTIKFWDLETFEPISSTPGESHGVRCIAFHTDGQSVFSGAQDSLRVYNWEPEAVCCDAIQTGWGKVDDMVIPVPNPQQLISVSHEKSLVRVWVCNLEKIRQRGDKSSVQAPVEPSTQPLSASGRQQFKVQYISSDDRPPTGPSRPQEIPLHQAQAEPPHEDGDDDDVPEADAEERKVIFSARSTLVRTPPKHSIEQFIIAAANEKPIAEKRELKFDDKALHGNMRYHQQQQHIQHQQQQHIQHQQQHIQKQPIAQKQKQEDHHEVKPAEESMGLNLEQFMPQAKPPLQHREVDHNVDEETVLKKLGKDSSQLCGILSTRLDNLQLIRREWDMSDAKASMESVIALNDKSVLVDMLNHVFCRKQSFWTLDLCLLVLPELKDLICDSKESYVHCGCAVIKLILKMFGPVIKENMQAPTGHGIDINREERYEKCQNCYSHLISLKDEAYKLKATSEPVSRLIRDLKNAFSRLN